MSLMATTRISGLIDAGFTDACIGREIIVKLVPAKTGRSADGGQHVAIADVEATLEITPEQRLHHLVLAARKAGVSDQPVGVEAVGGPPDAVEGEGDALGAAGFGDGPIDLARPLGPAEFERQIVVPRHAFRRHGGVELERPPGDRNRVAGARRQGRLQPALADEAPRADDV